MNENKNSDILLVEDNPGDLRLIMEAFNSSRMSNKVYGVENGEAALAFLRNEGEYENSPRPALILLDLSLPKKSGHEVLAEIRADRKLRLIPVIFLTTSENEEDIIKAYELYVNSYITKPVDLRQFIAVVKFIEEYWLKIVKLPEEQN